ncbi:MULTISPECIES: oxygenase MpaB family protein [Bacteria]|uniref:oxygenase MpaB family protein n=1 Tax=Bacteria TaxID=2 RepID=UPI003C79DABC
MSGTSPAPLPAVSSDARADEGYFGPESVSWKIFSDPATKLGGMAALLLQALNPNMMRLFDQATAAYADPAGRGERTGRFLETTIFGDRAHADAAALSVRRMHAHAVWTDPQTGQTLRADEPAWLAWTHNTLVFALLRAAEAFGLALTPAEQDAFVREQHVAAELVGCERSSLPATRTELEAYIDEQRHWMALCLPAAEVTRALRAPKLSGNPVAAWTAVIVQDGVLSLLPDWALLLYGVEGRPMNLRRAARTTRRLIGFARRNRPYERLVTEITDRVDTHPYRKVRVSTSRSAS